MFGSRQWAASVRQLSPAANAGGAARSAIVWVGPPLLANGASSGLIGAAIVPTMSPFTPLVKPVLPSLLPIRLWPCEVIVPSTSGLNVAVLSPTMLFLSRTGPVSKLLMPPPSRPELPLIVLLVTLMAPVAAKLTRPPPASRAELPLIVLLVTLMAPVLLL